MMGSGFNGFGMGPGWLFGLLIAAGVVLLIVLVARLAGRSSRSFGNAPPPPGGSGDGAARAVLQERYARGELSTEEYQERLRTLGGG